MRKTLFVLLIALLATLPMAGGTFQPAATTQAAGMTRYLVTVVDGSADLDTVARALVATYGGRTELYAREGFHGFLIVTTPERARRLSADARVVLVQELAAPVRDPGRSPIPTAVATQGGAAGLQANESLPAPTATTPPRESLPQPTRITPRRAPTDQPPSWSSGAYLYDGSGNVTAIGADTYDYDTAGRLVSGTADAQRTGSPTPSRQDFGYDAFGNRTVATTVGMRCAGATDCSLNTNASPDTNHLAIAEYDDAGNVVTFDSSYHIAYDVTGKPTAETIGTTASTYFIYGPDEQRIAVYGGGSWNWALRDQAGRLLREVTSSDASGAIGTANWQWKDDYIYAGTALLAEESAAGRWHFHLDHLGTPVVVTGDARQLIGAHSYYPFGAELDRGSSEQPETHLKFAGQERDILPGDVHTIDYVHARYYSAALGRFLSLDPVATADHGSSQGWNPYAYVGNNPMNHTDPTGEIVDTIADVVFTGYDIYDIVASTVRGEPVTATQNLALAADLVAIVIPGVTGAGAGVRVAAHAAEAAHVVETVAHAADGATHVVDATAHAVDGATHAADGAKAGDEVIHHFGTQKKSAAKLAEKAEQAEKNTKYWEPHGVSGTTKPEAGKKTTSALRSEIEKHFKVHNTGPDPNHRTIELPKPVTEEVAELFNRIFNRR